VAIGKLNWGKFLPSFFFKKEKDGKGGKKKDTSCTKKRPACLEMTPVERRDGRTLFLVL